MFDFGKNEIELDDGRVLVVDIMQDDTAEDPTTNWDCIGTVHSLSNRHIHSIGRDQALSLLGWLPTCPRCGHDNYMVEGPIKMGQPLLWCEYCGKWSVASRCEVQSDCVPLSYWQHSQGVWGVRGSLSEYPWFRFDGVDLAGVWEPDDCCLNELDLAGAPGSEERSNRALELAANACEVYTHYWNGEVYGYSVELFDEDWVVADDSCWGFYGWEEVEGAINDALAGMGVVLS